MVDLEILNDSIAESLKNLFTGLVVGIFVVFFLETQRSIQGFFILFLVFIILFFVFTIIYYLIERKKKKQKKKRN